MKQSAVAYCAIAVILGSTGWAQVTQRMSVDSAGAQGNGPSQGASISANGRYVLFSSTATNLGPGDTNGTSDAFVRDRQIGTTELISISSLGTQGNGDSFAGSISADGRYAAFASFATNLVPADTNGHFDVFVRDRHSGTTELVSIDSVGVQGNGDSSGGSISADGRYVAFFSSATNLVPGDTNGFGDVFVHDRLTGTTERVSIDSGGTQGDGTSTAASISADGRYVAFHSFASNLVLDDTNGWIDVFVRDRQNGTTERVSVATGGRQGIEGDSFTPSISADGRFVVFDSDAVNLVLGDTNFFTDVFVRDRQSGTTERVSLATGGAQGNANSLGSTISADGRYVAFTSFASNLVAGDMNANGDVFVRDRESGTTQRASVNSDGAEANGYSSGGTVSSDGRIVTFSSFATNLVPVDTNGAGDIFVYDRVGSGFTSLCDPAAGVVAACPCANQPSGLGHGCNNSSMTGGAVLSGSGVAYISMDSLVFATSGEKPTATSIVMSGDAFAPNGIFFGQGVRCVGGTLKRLYTKTAVGGSISAPDFGAGDPTISARSAALGDTILAGQSRWYLVYYRDPIVLGGCPSSITFNATQTGQVAWSL